MGSTRKMETLYHPRPSETPFNLVSHTGATGGILIASGKRKCRLTPVQFTFLQSLNQQRLEDASKHESVRGYVSSAVLIVSLPWETPHPDLAHLKQLVRRVRRRLEGSGLWIESYCGLGYRLRLDVEQHFPSDS